MYALSRFSFLLLPCMQAVVTGIYINYRSAALSRFARARAVAYARPHAQGVGTLSARVASRLANSLLLATLILSHLVVSRKERKPYKIVNYLPFVIAYLLVRPISEHAYRRRYHLWYRENRDRVANRFQVPASSCDRPSKGNCIFDDLLQSY